MATECYDVRKKQVWMIINDIRDEFCLPADISKPKVPAPGNFKYQGFIPIRYCHSKLKGLIEGKNVAGES